MVSSARTYCTSVLFLDTPFHYDKDFHFNKASKKSLRHKQEQKNTFLQADCS